MAIITRRITNNTGHSFTMMNPGSNNSYDSNIMIPANAVDLDLLTLCTEDSLWAIQVSLAALVRNGAISVTGTIDTDSFDYNGVGSLHADANPPITGNIQLVSGTNVVLSQVGQAITIDVGDPGDLSPGGPNTSLQFNNSGAFGGDANLTWDGLTLNTLGAGHFLGDLIVDTKVNTNVVKARTGDLALQPLFDSSTGVVVQNYTGSIDVLKVGTDQSSLTLQGQGLFPINFNFNGSDSANNAVSLNFNNENNTATFATINSGNTGLLQLQSPTGEVHVVTGSNVWNFDANGILTGPSSLLSLDSPNSTLNLHAGGNRSTIAIYGTPSLAGEIDFRRESDSFNQAYMSVDGTGNLYIVDAQGYTKIISDGSGSANVWLFDSAGKLTTPGQIDMNTNKIVNVVDPTDPQDAATKNYVDGGSHSVAGNNTEIQFNNSGAFGASPNFTWDNAGVLRVKNPSSYVDVILQSDTSSQVAFNNAAGNSSYADLALDPVGMTFTLETANAWPVLVKTNSGANTWAFDASGVLTTPGDVTVNTKINTDLITGRTGTLTLQALSDTTTAIQFVGTIPSSVVLNIDTANERVGINTVTPTHNLDIVGTGHLTNDITVDTKVNTDLVKGRTGTLTLEDLTGKQWTFDSFGVLTVPGNVNINTHLIHNVVDPVVAQDAATKAYVDNLSTIYVPQTAVGAPSGVASLDGGGKVPLSELPSTLMEFKGNWNPNTNTPLLVDGTGTNGFTYWVSAADANPVSGLNDPSMTNFQIGDLVIYNGSAWVLTTPAAGVQAVNGAQGAVTINAINQLTGDVTAGPASQSQSKVATLATVNSDVGSFTYANVTVNAKGLVTAASSGTTPVTSPAGSTTQIQYNNAGSFAGNSNLTWDGTKFSTTIGSFSTKVLTPLVHTTLDVKAIDITNRTLYDSSGTATSIDWENRTLSNTTFVTVDWVNGLLKTDPAFSGTTSVDWKNRKLMPDNTGGALLDWGSKHLIRTSGDTTLDWQTSQVFSVDNSAPRYNQGISIDWENRTLRNQLVSGFSTSVLNWAALGTIGINTDTPDASAALDVTSTTKGFLPPRLTTTQRNAVISPATGLQIYNTTTNQDEFYNGSVWGAISQPTSPAGTNTQIQYNNAGSFGASSKLTFNSTTGDLTLGNNQKLVLGNSGTAFLKYDSTNDVIMLEQETGDTQLSNTQTAFIIFPNGATTSSPALVLASVPGIGGVGAAGAAFITSSSLGAADVLIDLNGSMTIGKNNSAVVSAMLELVSTTKGFLPSRMTTTQKNAISSPATGLIVYDTTLNYLQEFNGSSWGSVSPVTTPAGSNTQLQYNNSGAFGASSNLTFDGANLSLTDNNKLIFGNSGNAFLRYDAVNQEYSFKQDSTAGLQITTPDSGFLLACHGGAGSGTYLPNVNLYTDGGGNPFIGFATTAFGGYDVLINNNGTVGIKAGQGGQAVPSAQLEVASTTRGFLPPRMTTTQRNAIISPATGLQIYNTTTSQNEFYNGSVWAAISSGGILVTTVTTTYTAAVANVISCDATTGSFAVSLPAVASSTNKEYTIKKIDSTVNTVTIQANGAETIDGSNTLILGTQWQSVTIVCDGTQWLII